MEELLRKGKFNSYMRRLKRLIESERCLDPYVGLRTVSVRFKKPYLSCSEYEIIVLEVMRLVIMYSYNLKFHFGKFTVGYTMKFPTGDVSYTIGTAFSLNASDGKAEPNINLYHNLLKLVREKAELYEKYVLSGLFIRVYMDGILVKSEEPVMRPPILDKDELATEDVVEEDLETIISRIESKLGIVTENVVEEDVDSILSRIESKLGIATDNVKEDVRKLNGMIPRGQEPP